MQGNTEKGKDKWSIPYMGLICQDKQTVKF